MPTHVFTPATARKTLSRLRPTAERMCRLYRSLERSRPRRVDSDQPVAPRYFSLLEQLYQALGEIRRAGVRIRDLRTGRLDFPARRGGRAVTLCWRVGESSLQFWYDGAANAAVRRPVDEDGPWEEGSG